MAQAIENNGGVMLRLSKTEAKVIQHIFRHVWQFPDHPLSDEHSSIIRELNDIVDAPKIGSMAAGETQEAIEQGFTLNCSHDVRMPNPSHYEQKE